MTDYFDLNKTFSCNYCHGILEQPVILPCSEPMCEKHVEELKTESMNINSRNIMLRRTLYPKQQESNVTSSEH